MGLSRSGERKGQDAGGCGGGGGMKNYEKPTQIKLNYNRINILGFFIIKILGKDQYRGTRGNGARSARHHLARETCSN